jgi:hypothetical protein
MLSYAAKLLIFAMFLSIPLQASAKTDNPSTLIKKFEQFLDSKTEHESFYKMLPTDKRLELDALIHKVSSSKERLVQLTDSASNKGPVYLIVQGEHFTTPFVWYEPYYWILASGRTVYAHKTSLRFRLEENSSELRQSVAELQSRYPARKLIVIGYSASGSVALVALQDTPGITLHTVASPLAGYGAPKKAMMGGGVLGYTRMELGIGVIRHIKNHITPSCVHWVTTNCNLDSHACQNKDGVYPESAGQERDMPCGDDNVVNIDSKTHASVIAYVIRTLLRNPSSKKAPPSNEKFTEPRPPITAEQQKLFSRILVTGASVSAGVYGGPSPGRRIQAWMSELPGDKSMASPFIAEGAYMGAYGYKLIKNLDSKIRVTNPTIIMAIDFFLNDSRLDECSKSLAAVQPLIEMAEDHKAPLILGTIAEAKAWPQRCRSPLNDEIRRDCQPARGCHILDLEKLNKTAFRSRKAKTEYLSEDEIHYTTLGADYVARSVLRLTK